MSEQADSTSGREPEPRQLWGGTVTFDPGGAYAYRKGYVLVRDGSQDTAWGALLEFAKAEIRRQHEEESRTRLASALDDFDGADRTALDGAIEAYRNAKELAATEGDLPESLMPTLRVKLGRGENDRVDEAQVTGAAKGWLKLDIGDLDPVGVVNALRESGVDAQVDHVFFADDLGASPFYGSPFYGSPFYGSPFYGSPFYGSPFYGSPFYGSPFYGSVIADPAVAATRRLRNSALPSLRPIDRLDSIVSTLEKPPRVAVLDTGWTSQNNPPPRVEPKFDPKGITSEYAALIDQDAARQLAAHGFPFESNSSGIRRASRFPNRPSRTESESLRQRTPQHAGRG